MTETIFTDEQQSHELPQDYAPQQGAGRTLINDENVSRVFAALDSDEFVRTLFGYLTSRQWGAIQTTDNKGNTHIREGWVQVEGRKPLMNLDGARFLTNEVFGRSNNIFRFSNTTDEQRCRLTLSVHKRVLSLIYQHCEEWQIDKSMRGCIADFIADLVFAALGQPLENKSVKDFLTSGKLYSESKTVGKQEKTGSGVFGMFK